jgi:hypothetical protein
MLLAQAKSIGPHLVKRIIILAFRLQKQTNEFQLNQNVKKNVHFKKFYFNQSWSIKFLAKSTHFNTRSFNKQGSFFINKHGCLNLLMLKQIMAMKEFRPTHEIKHDIFI